MDKEPSVVRAHVFIDGQNLTYAIRQAFGYHSPNYDILALARAVCERKGWQPTKISFYTGIPNKAFNPSLHRFWMEKMGVMRSKGINTVALPLRYVTTCTRRADGTLVTQHQAHEKGVDVRIAVDIIGSAHEPDCDAILLFSQDNDLKEALLGAKNVVARAQRDIQLACAYPVGPHAAAAHGIRGIPGVRIERALYDTCLDHLDYNFDPRANGRKAQADRAAKAQQEIEARTRKPSLAPA